MTTPTTSNASFSTGLAVRVFYRPLGTGGDWIDLDSGPGYFTLPADSEGMVRIQAIDDRDLAQLAADLQGCLMVRTLNLSENRNITDAGLLHFRLLPHLLRLNLSSCSLSNEGMPHLVVLSALTDLDLSYCNRLTDDGLRSIKKLPRLERLNLQGCVKITNGGVSRLRHRGLTINK